MLIIDKNLINSNQATIADVMDFLVDRGFPADQIEFPDDFNCIKQLLQQGAEIRHFSTAYDLAEKSVGYRNGYFDVRYLLGVVEGVMAIALQNGAGIA